MQRTRRQSAPGRRIESSPRTASREIRRPSGTSTDRAIRTIQGFATDISANLGETISFKVETDSPAYRIDIYRLGYYGGMGARLVATIKPSVPLPQTQPECLSDRQRAAVRLRQLGGVGVVGGAARCDVRRLLRAAGSRGRRAAVVGARQQPHRPRRRPAALPHAYGALGFGKLANALKEPRASHIYFIVRDDDQPRGPPLPDRRHRVAGRTTAPASPAPTAASIRRGRWSAPTRSA